jgi:hypothetical protein
MVECSCDEIRQMVKEIVNEIFNERLVKLTTEMKTKRKRKPSSYNLFVGKCMKEPGKNMKVCASEYRKIKEKGVDTFDIDSSLFGQ